MKINPVLARELRERMRTGRAFVAIGIFVALLILTVYLVYQGNSSTGDVREDLAQQTRLGRELFEWVLFVMTVLVMFFVPGLTAGAVAGERERQTLLPLQVTLLRPRNILVGKVLAGVSFLVLMVAASLPVLVIAYLLGGINLIDTIKGVGVVCAIAIVMTIIIASLSALTKRVQTATLIAYGCTALIILVGPLLYFTMAVADRSSGRDDANPPAVLLAANPISFVADATAGQNAIDADNPLRWVRRELVNAKALNDDAWLKWFPDDNPGATFRIIDGRRTGTPAWTIALSFMVLIACLFAILAVRRLTTPAETER